MDRPHRRRRAAARPWPLRRRRQAGRRPGRLFRALAARLRHDRAASTSRPPSARRAWWRCSPPPIWPRRIIIPSRIRIRFPAAAARWRSRRTGRRWPKARAACRRAGGDGDRGTARAAQDAGEKVAVDYQPLDAVTDVRAAMSSRRAAALAGSARQYRFRLDRAGRSRRQEAGGARSRLQGGRACGARRAGQPAPGRRLARAAHGDRELRRRRQAFTLALRHAGRRRRARADRRRHGHQAGGVAHPHRRCRRRLRHEGLVLSRIRRRCCMRRACCKSRSTGCRPARKPSSATTRAATRSGARSSRSTRAAAFSALRVDCLGNVGAYFTGVAHFVFTTHISGCLPTVYDIPQAQVNTRCVLTNTLPTGPYRGAGRPEASYLIERLIDAAADKTGIDAAELRRRNLIQARQIPYTTAFGNTYDSGDFPGAFERALDARRLRRLRRAQEGGEEGRQDCAASASAVIWRSPARFRKKPRALRFPAATG